MPLVLHIKAIAAVNSKLRIASQQWKLNNLRLLFFFRNEISILKWKKFGLKCLTFLQVALREILCPKGIFICNPKPICVIKFPEKLDIRQRRVNLNLWQRFHTIFTMCIFPIMNTVQSISAKLFFQDKILFIFES